jgi:hypothetical protein
MLTIILYKQCSILIYIIIINVPLGSRRVSCSTTMLEPTVTGECVTAQRRTQNRLLSYAHLRASPLPGQASVPQTRVVRFMESKSNEK